jgi:uncharacterized protein YndB with AHSA1/START domain
VGFTLDRAFVFDRAPDVVWAAIANPRDYPRWWSWLRSVEADGLTEGTTAHCLIRAPVPFTLRLALHVDRVVPGQRIEVTADGDLQGTGTLELAAHPDGTEARLVWELEPHQRLLRAAGLLSRPLLQWGQDWVVRTGARQFRRRALT